MCLSREVPSPKRTGRTQAKSDPLDAIRAGREALSREHLATPRQRGQREALGVLQLTRAGAVKVAADARRHLKALLVTAPEPLRAGLRGQTWLRQARAWAALTAQPNDPVEYRATVRALRTTAERPWPPTRRPPSSARSWPSWSGWWRRRCWPARGWPGHRRPGACQLVAPGPAALGGRLGHAGRRAPIEASSGRVVRHRLNRGGDRQLNRALHPIVMLCERYHQPTRRDVARRTAEGKASARSAAV
jgi:transposase